MRWWYCCPEERSMLDAISNQEYGTVYGGKIVPELARSNDNSGSFKYDEIWHV